MTGYTKQDTNNDIANGKVIDANTLDAEFDQLQDAFNNVTGHSHNGEIGEGGRVSVTGPNGEYEFNEERILPSDDNTYAIGSASRRFSNLYGVNAYVDRITVSGTSDATLGLAFGASNGLDWPDDGTGLKIVEGGEIIGIINDTMDDDRVLVRKGDGDSRYANRLNTIVGGNGLTGGGSLAGDRVISHADTSNQNSVSLPAGTVFTTVSVDGYGHVTNLSSYNLDNRYAHRAVTINAGGGLTGGGNLTTSRTINHADTSNQGSVNNSNGTVIQDIYVDGYGHVTNLGSVNLDNRYAQLNGDPTFGEGAVFNNRISIYHSGTNDWPSIRLNDNNTGIYANDADDDIRFTIDGVFSAKVENYSAHNLIDARSIVTRGKGDSRYQQLSSSRKYKEDIAYINKHPVIDDWKVASWTWGGELQEDDNKRGREGLGLIAEDMDKILPEAVTYNQDGEVEGLNSLALIGVLVKEIQSLKARVAELEG